jgi:hypothetical protein
MNKIMHVRMVPNDDPAEFLKNVYLCHVQKWHDKAINLLYFYATHMIILVYDVFFSGSYFIAFSTPMGCFRFFLESQG